MSQILLFLVYPSVLFYSLKVTGLSCRQERSKRGFALFYKNYSSSFKDDHPECVSLCVNDPNCMSLNYWLNSKSVTLEKRYQPFPYQAKQKKSTRESYFIVIYLVL